MNTIYDDTDSMRWTGSETSYTLLTAWLSMNDEVGERVGAGFRVGRGTAAPIARPGDYIVKRDGLFYVQTASEYEGKCDTGLVVG